MFTATVLKNTTVSFVVKTRKTAKIHRSSYGNTYTVKLSSSAHAQVIAFQKYLAEKKRYETCVDRHDKTMCKKADNAAGMFRSGC